MNMVMGAKLARPDLYPDAGRIELTNMQLLDALYTMVDSYYTWTGRNAMEILNFFYNENFFIPPAHSNGWTPRSTTLQFDMMEEEEVISVYPNPANQLLNIELNIVGQSSVKGQLIIFDLRGKIVDQHNITNARQVITLDTRMWESGMYTFQLVVSGGENKSGRFEIIH